MNFAIDLDRRVAQYWIDDPIVYLMESFIQGDLLDITCSLVQKTYDNKYVLAATPYVSGALNITIGTPSVMSSSLLSNTTCVFDNINTYYKGSLNMSSSAMQNFLEGLLYGDATFSIQYSGSGIVNTVYQERITMYAELIK